MGATGLLAQAEWWSEMFDWRQGRSFFFNRATGERSNINRAAGGRIGGSDGGDSENEGGNSGNSGMLFDASTFSGVAGGSSEAVFADMRFRAKRCAFQKALRKHIGVRAFSSAVAPPSPAAAPSHLMGMGHSSPLIQTVVRGAGVTPWLEESNGRVGDAVGWSPAGGLEPLALAIPGAPSFEQHSLYHSSGDLVSSVPASPAQPMSPSSPSSPASPSSYSSRYLWMKTSRQQARANMLARFSTWDPMQLRKKRLKVRCA